MFGPGEFKGASAQVTRRANARGAFDLGRDSSREAALGFFSAQGAVGPVCMGRESRQ